jgi:ubiquinone/menaquinone biosynthesis C-methylase UbiE
MNPGASAEGTASSADVAARPNHFDSPAAAARYAAARPRGHDRVLALVRAYLEPDLPVDDALDVGCGTGHSTEALLPLARRIVGLDASSFMLAQAPRLAGITYRKGHAEALPFGAAQFDLVTAATAYHWFEQDRFMTEAARVLRPGGFLAVYKVGSTGRVASAAGFAEWWRDEFRTRYPRVAPPAAVPTAGQAAELGLRERAHEIMERTASSTLTAYVENLLSHSSLIRGLAERGESVATVRAWLTQALAPHFPGGVAEIQHEDWLHLWQKPPTT